MRTRAHQQKAKLASMTSTRAQFAAGGAVHSGANRLGRPGRGAMTRNTSVAPRAVTRRSRLPVPGGGRLAAFCDHRAGIHQVTYQTAQSQ